MDKKFFLEIICTNIDNEEMAGCRRKIGPGNPQEIEKWLDRNGFKSHAGSIWFRENGTVTLTMPDGQVSFPRAEKVWATLEIIYDFQNVKVE